MTQVRVKRNLFNQPLYQPLVPDRKEIRLLAVKAGSRAAPLICTLCTVSLLADPRPRYETISYFWGDATQTGIISVNDREVAVPSSAKNALLCMRHSSQDRMLWIDAICINQQDFDERAQQVSIMGDVYHNGHRGLIYLGEDDGTAHETYKAIQIVLDDARDKTENFETWHKTIANDDRMETRSQIPPAFQPDWDILERFYARPWFKRLWIIQEVALSPEGICYCGEVSFPLLDVLRAATWVTYHGHYLPLKLVSKVGTLGPIADMADHEFGWSLRGKDRAPTLTWLLDLARRYETTDPRDRIYAILGLTKWALQGEPLPSPLVPDYQKSLREILRNVTKYLVQTESRLGFYSGMNFGWEDEDTVIAVPSWIPRWDQTLRDGRTHTYHLSNFFIANDNMCTWLDIDDTEQYENDVGPGLDMLPFVGLYVDAVSAVSCVFEDSNDSGEESTNSLAFLNDVKKLVDITTVGRALIASRNFSGEYATLIDVGESKEYLEYIRTRHRLPVAPPRLPGNASMEEQAAGRYWNSLWMACLNRRFFVTRDGRHGIGPGQMMTGDIVTVLYGSRWPFVLRPVDQEHYRMIGICYIEGIMFGEAVRENQAKGGGHEVFRII